MRFHSTRNPEIEVGLREAIQQGLAPDGGLYVPDQIPSVDPNSLPAAESLAETATALLAPFFAGEGELGEQLGEICSDALNFPVPLVEISNDPGAWILELFHGPTAAFKDVGARFLAACLQRIESGADKTLNILVATSGDTGGAVAAAFHRRPGIRVFVLYPKGMVSPRQEHQLTCWGDNVHALRVDGDFDACQALVKQAFTDSALRDALRLSSANSISIGRLLPQMAYYAYSSLALRDATSAPPGYIIPTGNLGNALACIWARAIGMRIGDIRFATNANRSVPDFLASGDWRPRDTVATLASAMDVGNPSNMERLRHLFPDFDRLAEAFRADSVSDDVIRDKIRQGEARYGQQWCPHTATAIEIFEQQVAKGNKGPWVMVATAHPAKFETIVEPLIGRDVPIPPPLAALLDLPTEKTDIGTDYPAFREHLLNA